MHAPVPLLAERQPQVVVEGHHALTLKAKHGNKSKQTADMKSKQTFFGFATAAEAASCLRSSSSAMSAAMASSRSLPWS